MVNKRLKNKINRMKKRNLMKWQTKNIIKSLKMNQQL